MASSVLVIIFLKVIHDLLPYVLYASKITQSSWLVVASRYSVPVFVLPNCMVILNRNGLDVRAQECALGVPLGDLFLRIT